MPQGSVLGPLLFLLHVADIDSIVEDHGLLSYYYADDAQLWFYAPLGQQDVLCGTTVTAYQMLRHGCSQIV